MKKEFNFLSADGKTNIYGLKWVVDKGVTPIANIIIGHGMTEHMGRYVEMGEYLTERGYNLIGFDFIGHGHSISEDATRMHFGPIGSWSYVVRDMEKVRQLAEKEYPNIPTYLLGFSLGSFLVRQILIDIKPNVDGVILIGTGQKHGFELSIAKNMIIKEVNKIGEEGMNDRIRHLSFGHYNKMFKPNRTYCDWLAKREKAVDEYISDRLCGDCITAGLFYQMLYSMDYTGKVENIKKMDENMPILIMSGEKDPVGDFCKGINLLKKVFAKAGMKNVNTKIYEDIRHDILREEERKQVYQDIIDWIKTHKR